MSNPIRILIIGGYGTALNIAESIEHASINFNMQVEILGFVNDQLEHVGKYKVVCKIHELDYFLNFDDVRILFALYKPNEMKERLILFNRIQVPRNKFFTFIHPSVYLPNSVVLGIGNVILPNTIIMSNVKIGDYNIINSGVIIEHDTITNNNNFISGGAVVGSKVRIGSGVFIGLNSTIREGLCIADYAFLGMGSVLTKNIGIEEVFYGVPAKRI